MLSRIQTMASKAARAAGFVRSAWMFAVVDRVVAQGDGGCRGGRDPVGGDLGAALAQLGGDRAARRWRMRSGASQRAPASRQAAAPASRTASSTPIAPSTDPNSQPAQTPAFTAPGAASGIFSRTAAR
ncbi:hypothetical protein [Kitasatospora sp. NPDC056800]|uniref:hypothetical protein n=1 Tax=Kitasatospora sp. NPDC056800 TaxID=3345948 RepID=UPI0036A11F5C